MLKSEQFLDIVCVAAPRSGTTWLARALGEHPGVWVHPIKELNFFNDRFLNHKEFNYPRGIDYYRSRFEGAPEDALLADLTPTYYADTNAAFRIHSHFPDVKILVLLRNPADVVFSTYLKVSQYQLMEDSFEAAVENHPEFVNLGFYHRQLTPFYDWFPEDRIHVRTHEQLFANPEQEIAEVYRFVGVDAGFRPKVLGERINPRRRVRSRAVVWAGTRLQQLFNTKPLLPVKRLLTKSLAVEGARHLLVKRNLEDGELPTLSAESRAWLMRQFAPDMARLEKMLEFDLDSWREKTLR